MTGLKWTEEDMASRLGASSMAVRTESLGGRHLSIWRELGIGKMEICGWERPGEYLHYDHNDRHQLKDISSEARNQGVEIVSVHAPQVPLSCDSERERRGAVRELAAAAEAALELGASIFVCHFRYPGGLNHAAERSVREMLDLFDGSPMKLLEENGEDLHDFVKLVDNVGSKQFGMCVDIGHTVDPDKGNPFTKNRAAYETMSLCGQRVMHLHLHDFRSGAKNPHGGFEPDHFPPFDGEIKWEEILLALQDMQYGGVLMFESAGFHENVLQKIAAFPRKLIERLEGHRTFD